MRSLVVRQKNFLVDHPVNWDFCAHMVEAFKSGNFVLIRISYHYSLNRLSVPCKRLLGTMVGQKYFFCSSTWTTALPSVGKTVIHSKT